MKKIAITLDDVIRAKTFQIGQMYKKFINHDIKLETLSFDNTDYATIFGFETIDEYKKFLYYDYVYEIFGNAPMVDKLVDKLLNNWLLELNLDYESCEDGYLDVMLANAFEFNTSIGNTYFFLARMATRVREIYLPTDSSTVWQHADIVVTATPEILKSKPEGAISIKIATDYNKDIEADYTYASLNKFIEDKETLEKIRKAK